MKLLRLAVRNALRNRRRVVLTASSLAVSVFLLVTLMAVVTYMRDVITRTEERRIMITHGRFSFLDPLPISYAARIAQVPGVDVTNAITLIIGTTGPADEVVNGMALVADTYLETGPEHDDILPAQFEAFRHNRTALLAGRAMARRFGWKIGDRVTIHGSRYPVDLQCTVAGFLTPSILSDYFAIHREYLEEALGPDREVGVNFFSSRVASNGALPAIVEQVDQLFANSAAETKSQPQRDFLATLASLAGDMRAAVLSISLIVLLAIVTVVSNSIAMSVRERTREIAVLKAIGFVRAHIVTLVLAESLLVALAGGGLGAAAASALFASIGFSVAAGPSGYFVVTPAAIAIGLAVSAAVGVAAGGVPAWMASRLTIVDALRWAK
jgi:putative ABC transport system permease protein